MHSDSIAQLLAKIDTLPASPFPLPELFKALGDVDSDPRSIVDMISLDPSLTATLLQTCNSAFFGRTQRVNNVAEAVNRLGFQTIYRMVAAVRGSQVLRPSGKSYGLDQRKLWRHSVSTAFAAQFVGEDLGMDSGLLFTAGLLHDIGKVILANALKEQYARLLDEVAQTGRTVVEVEMSTYGWTHAEAGAHLLARWNFSPEMVASVEFHHHSSPLGPWERSAYCITLANALAHQVDREHCAKETMHVQCEEALHGLGLTQEALTRYQDRLQENVAFAETLCSVAR